MSRQVAVVESPEAYNDRVTRERLAHGWSAGEVSDDRERAEAWQLLESLGLDPGKMVSWHWEAAGYDGLVYRTDQDSLDFLRRYRGREMLELLDKVAVVEAARDAQGHYDSCWYDQLIEDVYWAEEYVAIGCRRTYLLWLANWLSEIHEGWAVCASGGWVFVWGD